MGYAVYEDDIARDFGVRRWAGYGVPAICDMSDCETEIDRGMGYRCERAYEYRYFRDGVECSENDDWDQETEAEVDGCQLHFCEEHLDRHEKHKGVEPKPDTDEWVAWMLTDSSWGRWRRENKTERDALYSRLNVNRGMSVRDIKRMAVEADS